MIPDRSKGMKQICRELQNKGIVLSKLDALDVFAREGDWQTYVYAGKVKSLTAWEINPEFEAGLRKNFSKARIEITDSIKRMKENQVDRFDFIVIDNPQGTFGENNEYCEHFDVLPFLSNIIDNEAIVVFNINREPFSFEDFPAWKKRREDFYHEPDTSKFSLYFLMKFYKSYFLKYGFETNFIFSIFREECKPLDYLYYLVLQLVRK